MPGIYLQLVEGTTRDGKVLRLPGERFVVGRSKRCHVRLRSEATSRRQAIFHLTPKGWVVEDQGSSNGTWLRKKRIEIAALRPMDVIVFGQGDAKVRVISLDPAPPIEAADEAPTRYVRTPDKTRRPKPRESRRAPAKAAVLAAAGASKAGARTWPPILTLAGLIFGLLTAWQLMGPRFPYTDVAAPALWALHGIRSHAPELFADAGDYLLRFALGVWFAGLGFALQRPLTRYPLLVAIGLLQAGAILALHGRL